MKSELALAAASTAFAFTPAVSVGYIGVPLNVLVACIAGAYCSFAFGDKIEPRGHMFQVFFACIVLGSGATGIMNYALDHWLHAELTLGAQAGIGSIISCLTRFWFPSLIEMVKNGTWVQWIPFLRKRE